MKNKPFVYTHRLAQHYAIALLIVLTSLNTGCLSSFVIEQLLEKNYADAPQRKKDKDKTITYRLSMGDLIEIIVWQYPQLSVKLPIRPDGMISIPLVDDVPAINRSPSDLARELEQALSRFINNPNVSILVQRYNLPFNEQIRILGQVNKPQTIPYQANMTAIDALIASEGLTARANGNRTILWRTQEQKQYKIRLYDILRHGDISANIELRPGDVIIVPESIF